MIPIADTWHGKNCGVVFPRSRWGLTWLDPLDPYPARCYARALAWTLATSWIPGMREVDDLAISRLCWSRSMIFHDISWYFFILGHPVYSLTVWSFRRPATVSDFFWWQKLYETRQLSKAYQSHFMLFPRLGLQKAVQCRMQATKGQRSASAVSYNT